MKPIMRIADYGKFAFLELDGKAMGTGVESIKYQREGTGPASLEIAIDLGNFHFMPDGSFDEMVNEMENK